MEWYSYFFISLPESFIMTLFTFVLLGISIRTRKTAFILFCSIDSIFTYGLTLLMDNSIKPLLTLFVFFSLFALFFKRSVLHSAMVTIITFFFLTLFDSFSILMMTWGLGFDTESMLANPLYRILGSSISLLFMVISILALHFTKFKIKSPLQF